MKRRFLLILSIVALCGFGTAVFVTLFRDEPPGLTWGNVGRIKARMYLQDVTVLLGQPPSDYRDAKDPPSPALLARNCALWENDQLALTVFLDGDNYVLYRVAVAKPQPSPYDRIRGWFQLNRP